MPFHLWWANTGAYRESPTQNTIQNTSLTETVALEANKANMRVDNDLNILLLFSYQSNLFLDEQQVK